MFNNLKLIKLNNLIFGLFFLLMYFYYLFIFLLKNRKLFLRQFLLQLYENKKIVKLYSLGNIELSRNYNY